MIIIEIIGSLLYFGQKVFLSFGKRIGWALGFFGAVAYIIVTFNKGSFAYTLLEITSVIIFVFGFFMWRKNQKIQQGVTLAMSAVVIIGVVMVFYLNLGSPNWILENIMVVLFAVGAALLALRNPIGWILYILGHIVLIAYAYILGTYSILILQIASIPFAVIGYKNFKNTKTTYAIAD